jgi:hypothetical protein
LPGPRPRSDEILDAGVEAVFGSTLGRLIQHITVGAAQIHCLSAGTDSIGELNDRYAIPTLGQLGRR